MMTHSLWQYITTSLWTLFECSNSN